MAKITGAQIRLLQTLYGQYAAHEQLGSYRASRIAWAEELIQRPIKSFSELSIADGKHLIDVLSGQLRRPAPAPRLSRDDAYKAGTEGRKGHASTEITLAGKRDFERIQNALNLLGWSQDQFNAWLSSPRSPIASKSNPSIRTLAEANRIWWALKGMASKRGLKARAS